MNTELYQKIINTTSERISRENNAHFILENPHLLPDLLELAFSFHNEKHYKACWVLELVLEEKPELLSLYFDYFFENFKSFTHDGAFRSIAKIILFLSQHHLKMKKSGYDFLNEKQLQEIIELAFDKILNPKTKVAAMVYLIRALYYIGQEIDWIHPELKLILNRDYHNYSAGYKAAAREILKKLK